MSKTEQCNIPVEQVLQPELQELQVNVDLTSCVSPVLAMLPTQEVRNTQIAVDRSKALLAEATSGVEGVSPLTGIHVQPGKMFNIQALEQAVAKAGGSFAITAADKPYIHTISTTFSKAYSRLAGITKDAQAGNIPYTKALEQSVMAFVQEHGWARMNVKNYQQMLYRTTQALELTKPINGQVMLRLCSQELYDTQKQNQILQIIKQADTSGVPIKILIEPNASYHNSYGNYVDFIKQQQNYWRTFGVEVAASIDVVHLEEIRLLSGSNKRVEHFLEDLLGGSDAQMVGLLEVSNIRSTDNVNTSHTLPLEGSIDLKAVFAAWGSAYQKNRIQNTPPMLVFETLPTQYNDFLATSNATLKTLANEFYK